MPSSAYSFIDVAVLDAVREHLATGDAIVILSTDLAEVAWANGPGAALFGHSDIEAMVGADSGLGFAAKRQIMATRGYPEIGQGRAITVRLARGLDSRAMAFSASAIALPDGEAAIMLVLPAGQAGAPEADVAARAIGGFTDPGHLVAFLDEAGAVEAASQGFAALEIPARVLADLATEVAGEPDRLVKRIIPSGTGTLPAGIARLRDQPARHLLVVVAEQAPTGAETPDDEARHSVAEPTVEIIETTSPAARLEAQATDTPVASTERMDDAGLSISTVPLADQSDQAEVGTSSEAVFSDEPSDVASSSIALKDGPSIASDEGSGTQESVVAAAAMDKPPEATVEAPKPTIIDRSAAPIRFAWKTDATGRFSAISPEFLAAVGSSAGDVLGHPFSKVSDILGLDPQQEIAGLLERRDTWSGRSVLWPVAETGMKVPVDLAALPVYSRDRSFEGFRGFGIARLADTIVDAPVTQATPPSMGEPGVDAVDTIATDEPTADPFRGEVPALTIVPKADRRASDKIIRLAEHRTQASEKGLSPVERSAFREIGEKLKKAEGLEQTGNGEAHAVQPVVPPEARVEDDLVIRESAGDTGQPHETAPAAPSTAEADGPSGASEPATLAVQDSGDGTPLPMPHDGGREGRETTAVLAEPPPSTEPDLALSEETPAAIADPHAERGEAEATGLAGTVGPAAHHGDNDLNGDVNTVRVETAEGPLSVGGSHQETNATPISTWRAAPTRDVDTISLATGTESETRPDETSAEAEPVSGTDPSSAPAVEAMASAAPAEVTPVAAARAAIAELKTNGVMPSAVSSERPIEDAPILSRLPVPILIHSGDRLHYANDEFLNLTGYGSLKELAQAGGLDALFVDPYEQESAEGTDKSLRLKAADGSVFPIEALLRAVPWSGGRALMLVVRRTGDLEEDDAEASPFAQPYVETLRARVAEMRAIIDTATDGVILITKDGMIRSISRPAEALFGLESDEVGGKPFVSLFAMESQRAARDYLSGLTDHGVASVLNDGREVIGREAEGRFIPLFMTIGSLPNDSGYCAVVRDITPWKRAEEELTQARSLAERASSQKSDFLARISHEIRTPLNAIIGFSELMIDERFGVIGNDRYRDYLRDINRSGNHVLELVNDLLDISKIEAGEQEMAHEAVPLNETLTQTVAMMQPQANRERVIIRSSLASRLPDVVADPRSVRQIALNLLSNAVRYTQAGGQVIVSTAYEPSGDVVMRVRDTGIGMTQAEIEQALKPFKQINALKRARGDGTGLGLPLTKAMVEANRARFTIHSTPGEGTLVEVAFPSTRVLAT